MARKISGGLVGQPSVGAINVAPTAVVTAAENQDITLSPIGTGSLIVTNNIQLNEQNDLRFADADSSNYVAFQSPSTVASNVTWTLPNADGTNRQALSTDGTGTLSWQTPAISITNDTTSSSTHYVAVTTATSGNISGATVSDTRFTFQPSTGDLTVAGVVRSLTTENVQTGNYTLQLTDQDRAVTMNNGASATVTIPTDATVNFPIGSTVLITRIGAGALTLAAPGVTINAGGTGNLAIGETVECRKRAANNWFVNQRPYSVTGTGGTLATLGDVRVHSYTAVASSTFVVGT
jgi:hypothetical protein